MSTSDSARPAGVAVATGDGEEAILAKVGYKPELRRSLRFFSMFAIAFSIISITTGIFLNYGWGLRYWGPASIWTWPIVGVGNVLIALVVAELGTRIPLAGYAYQWSARLVNPTYGWFVGFAGLLYMSVGGGARIGPVPRRGGEHFRNGVVLVLRRRHGRGHRHDRCAARGERDRGHGS